MTRATIGNRQKNLLRDGILVSLPSLSLLPLLSIYAAAIERLRLEKAFKIIQSKYCIFKREQIFEWTTLLQLQNLYSNLNLLSLFQWGLGVFCSGCSNSSSLKSINLKLYMCKEISRRICNKGSFKKPTHSIYLYSNPELAYYSHENADHKDYWKERLRRKIKKTWKSSGSGLSHI